ncbi:hypothetical protein [Nodosilinea sp. LEGE 07088]|uniref:hypothetical protein n=1 Tax=Nodosilinea sp. LEGE 07088 TaxID=2777968 RepID=UPI001D13DD56|nr:hypothetical protein [Nodosilinea sp. LEGE 07088]
MSFTRWLRRLAPLMVCLLLLVTACTSAPSKYDQVQEDTTGFGSPAAVDKKAEKGGTFNQFFPDSQEGYTVTPYQEKKGFAEYKLEQSGKTLAMLTISDTTSLPAAAEKYTSATESIDGFPAVDQGTTGTGLLVNGRYQVKVLSRDPAFAKADRVAWLQKFDLKGLAELKGAITPAGKAAALSRPPAKPVASAQTKAPNTALVPAQSAPSAAPKAPDTVVTPAKPAIKAPPAPSTDPILQSAS